ncbi:MAG TPA: DUF998 domain-containing protein [Thermoplasmata archaeon]|nr:DUF998 domain-containing protein [Thermoplasmata archaeon]
MGGDPGAPSAPSERYGPLVHRSVRHGAILYIVGVIEFIVGMVVTQLGYSGTTYSLTRNYISDLGAYYCGVYHASVYPPNGIYVCSPLHEVFNVSIILMGLLLVVGTLLIRTGFPARATRSIGLGLLVIAGIGAIGVGLAPEDYNTTVHVISAGIAFLLGNLALIVLALAMFRDTRWDGYRAYTLLSGVVGLIAFGLFYAGIWGPLGVGGMERLIVAPLLLWALLAGIHLARIPTFAPATMRGART